MPVDKFANMEEKLWILEDLNMMYIRQIALSLQVKVYFNFQLTITCILTLCTRFCCSYLLFSLVFLQNLKVVGCVSERSLCNHVSDCFTFFLLIDWQSTLNTSRLSTIIFFFRPVSPPKV